MCVGMADCIVQRVSATRAIWALKSIAMPWHNASFGTRFGRRAEPHGMTPFGMRAMMSLRLDKFFGSWMSEFSPDYTAAETGYGSFHQLQKERRVHRTRSR